MSIAVQMAKQYLSQIAVGEWQFSQSSLVAPDGTAILWVTQDINHATYLGAMEDYVDFIARSSLLVKALVDEIEREKR